MLSTDDLSWWREFRDSDSYRKFLTRPVAYFCAEFGLAADLPIYAGGLGILAGDVVREAADQQFPLVAVGLYYHGDCRKHSSHPRELTPVIIKSGHRASVRVPLRDGHILVWAVKFEVGSIPVYLLTTDVPGNSPADREITANLYPSNKEKRLQQEIVLGLGGLRLLETLRIHPSIYHLNEGHSSLLALEIAAHETRERGISFADGLELAKNRIVFTNHTLLPAGNDVFVNDMVAANLTKFAEEMAVPVDDLVKLGLIQDSSLFSMTMLSLRLAGKINAVSRFHAKKAAETWTDHPMEGITNGIHTGTWDRINFSEKSAKSAKISLYQITDKPDSDVSDLSASRSSADHSRNSEVTVIYQFHRASKLRLLAKVHSVTGQLWPEDALLLGWGRRIVSYKRPLAIFADIERLKKICLDSARPVKIVISGNAQEGDEEGQKLLSELKSLLTPASQPQPDDSISSFAVYLPNFDMDLAQLMTAGCDVWLNTPVVGFEACGTSGMKAGLNGTLLASTKDGWIDEANGELGDSSPFWILNSDNLTESFLTTLEKSIIPAYYNLDTEKAKWVELMNKGRELILEKFSTTRLLKEYIEKLYLPLVAI